MLKYSVGILGIALCISAPALAQANTNIVPVEYKGAPSTFTAEKQYLVYVNDVSLLPQVKNVVPDAFVGSLDSGKRVIQVGRYNNQNLAQRRADQLRLPGIAPEVIAVSARTAAFSPVVNEGFATTPIVTNIPSPGATQDLVPLPGVPFTPATASDRPNEKTIEISRGNPNVPSPLAVSDTAATTTNPVRNRYFVVVPSSQETVLQKARAIAPSARMAVSERGTYVEVQGFPDRGSAETLNKTVRSQGLDARIIYF